MRLASFIILTLLVAGAIFGVISFFIDLLRQIFEGAGYYGFTAFFPQHSASPSKNAIPLCSAAHAASRTPFSASGPQQGINPSSIQ